MKCGLVLWRIVLFVGSMATKGHFTAGSKVWHAVALSLAYAAWINDISLVLPVEHTSSLS